MTTRLTGMLVDQEFGILIYAPVYVLAIWGAISLVRARRDLAFSIFLVVGVYVALLICPLTNAHGWTGGWNPAARFLTPITPLVGLCVFAGLRTAPRAVAVIVVALQVAVSAYAWQHPKILWNDGDGRAAFCEPLGERICALFAVPGHRGHSTVTVPGGQPHLRDARCATCAARTAI